MPVRADLVHNVGQILEDVTSCISGAAVVVVDITDANPNVMYELGYAHALGKPTVLICNAQHNGAPGEGIPFDIRGMRVLRFNLEEPAAFLSTLVAVIEKIMGVVC